MSATPFSGTGDAASEVAGASGAGSSSEGPELEDPLASIAIRLPFGAEAGIIYRTWRGVLQRWRDGPAPFELAVILPAMALHAGGRRRSEPWRCSDAAGVRRLGTDALRLGPATGNPE